MFNMTISGYVFDVTMHLYNAHIWVGSECYMYVYKAHSRVGSECYIYVNKAHSRVGSECYIHVYVYRAHSRVGLGVVKGAKIPYITIGARWLLCVIPATSDAPAS